MAHYSSNNDGPWSDSSTWMPSGVPGAEDDVLIGHNVYVLDDAACNNISVSGNLFVGAVSRRPELVVGGSAQGSAWVGYSDEGQPCHGRIRFVGGTNAEPKLLQMAVYNQEHSSYGEVVVEGVRATAGAYTIGQTGPLRWYLGGTLRASNGNNHHLTVAGAGLELVIEPSGKLDLPQPVPNNVYQVFVLSGASVVVSGEIVFGASALSVGTAAQPGGRLEVQGGGSLTTYILDAARGVWAENGGEFINRGRIEVRSINQYSPFVIGSGVGGKVRLYKLPFGGLGGYGVIQIYLISGEIEILARTRAAGVGFGGTPSALRTDRIPRGGGLRLAG